MASFRIPQKASWPALAIVAVVALAAWGAYVWRAAPGKSSAQTAIAQRADSPVAPLRATRPAKMGDALDAPLSRSSQGDESASLDRPGSEAAGPSIAVAANMAPSLNRPAEMSMHAPAAPPTAAGLQAGREALARGELLVARTALSAEMNRQLSPADAEFARVELSRLADAMIFSRATNLGDPLVSVHTVTAGDTLNAIAQRSQITEELLASINRVTEPNHLHVGQRLKVIRGPFNLVISKSRHQMDVYLRDVLVRSFRVGLGTNGGTPTGVWTVNNKLGNPDWTDPRTNRHYAADEPDNPIGERWIGLSGVEGEALGKVGFGIHGTIDPASIGENLSMGCIRMRAEDVALVYDLLVLNHSRVTIRP